MLKSGALGKARKPRAAPKEYPLSTDIQSQKKQKVEKKENSDKSYGQEMEVVGQTITEGLFPSDYGQRLQDAYEK